MSTVNAATMAVLVAVPVAGVIAWLVRDWDLRPLRLPLSALGLVLLAVILSQPHGHDVIAYWLVDPLDPYAIPNDGLQGTGAFRYAPPMALVMAPLSLLPAVVVLNLWTALQLGALWYIGRGWALALIVFPPVWMDLAWGNINVLLAAMIVAGFRHPEAWGFGLLTKVTPGIGLVWFAARREWRALARAGVVTAAIVGVSLVIQGPGVWLEWVRGLTAWSGAAGEGAIPLPVIPRIGAAVLLIAWGGLTDRRWTVPVAVTLAMPVLWPVAFAPLVAMRSRPW